MWTDPEKAELMVSKPSDVKQHKGRRISERLHVDIPGGNWWSLDNKGAKGKMVRPSPGDLRLTKEMGRADEEKLLFYGVLPEGNPPRMVQAGDRGARQY